MVLAPVEENDVKEALFSIRNFQTPRLMGLTQFYLRKLGLLLGMTLLSMLRISLTKIGCIV